jgi:hypothetical protein
MSSATNEPAMAPAGWYPNPDDGAQVRWWNGQAWTDTTQPRVEAPAPPAPPVPPMPFSQPSQQFGQFGQPGDQFSPQGGPIVAPQSDDFSFGGRQSGFRSGAPAGPQPTGFHWSSQREGSNGRPLIRISATSDPNAGRRVRRNSGPIPTIIVGIVFVLVAALYHSKGPPASEHVIGVVIGVVLIVIGVVTLARRGYRGRPGL